VEHRAESVRFNSLLTRKQQILGEELAPNTGKDGGGRRGKGRPLSPEAGWLWVTTGKVKGGKGLKEKSTSEQFLEKKKRQDPMRLLRKSWSGSVKGDRWGSV